ncbi:MAG: flippase-like domain-containing protein, partial [Chloroflexi bacterium]|nr:flippase-like domain-containing protein [Chloroflexota bacterium]
MKKTVWDKLRSVAIYSLLAALLYFALRNAPLTEIWAALRRLQGWQLLALLGLNGVIYSFITLRWQLIIRAEKQDVRFLPLLAARVAAFGVSYFTPGPQVGGEPVQVLYLQRNYGLTYVRAVSTVVMDKLLEFLAGFVLLGFGLTAVFQAGIFSTSAGGSLAALGGLVLL